MGFVLYRQKRQCNENITNCRGKLVVLLKSLHTKFKEAPYEQGHEETSFSHMLKKKSTDQLSALLFFATYLKLVVASSHLCG